MKILFVHPATSMSIGDVARGYRSSLERHGHDVADYFLSARYNYHRKAIPPEMTNSELVAKCATENIMVEALYHKADLVLIISGLNVWPGALWLLGQVGIPVAVVLTESPYDDESQKMWADLSHVNSSCDMTFFTNDRYSAELYGWNFLPPSFDPAIHKPVEPSADFSCDVLMIGTGWPDRQAMLEAVDWTGIDLKIYGVWPGLTPGSTTYVKGSPLEKFYRPLVVNNEHAPAMYCGSKINVNINRSSDVALTPGPRIYELAACGAFQISDPREDLVAMFGSSIPTFNGPVELGERIRYYLDHPHERAVCAAGALDKVLDETFDKRVEAMERVFERRFTGVEV